jgi:hypothetical protein
MQWPISPVLMINYRAQRATVALGPGGARGNHPRAAKGEIG